MLYNLPPWLKKRVNFGDEYKRTEEILKDESLNTVCKGAHCPNIGECFSKGTATFMILGNVCTRNCAFCAVPSGKPEEVDLNEPERIALAVKKLGLKHVVITSVTRDDLKDGGSGQFEAVIKTIRQKISEITIEVLTPDFRGDIKSLASVIEAGIDVFNHNLETISRLYSKVRPQADYKRSLQVLAQAKKLKTDILTKSGIMVGLGERPEEVYDLMKDLIDVGCDIITIGQYLQPSEKHYQLYEFVHPDQFAEYEWIGYELGFKYVFSGPLVRSSFHAGEALKHIR